MVLLGALMAGDSVKETLRQVAAARMGKVDSVLSGGDRFFRAALADELAADQVDAAPVMFAKARASMLGSGRALGDVRVLGVDRRFWKFGPDEGQIAPPQGRDFFINEALSQRLEVQPGDALVLRIDPSGLLAEEAPLAGKAANGVILRGNVSRVCDDREFGRFSLENTQVPQLLVWVPIERLQAAMGFQGKANLMLTRDRQQRGTKELLRRIASRCTLEDYGLTVNEVPQAKSLEIRTARVFFDRQVAAAIRGRFPFAQPVITYLANTISSNGKQTPYSMVTATGAEAAPFLPKKLDGAMLNSWEADDLGAKEGDEVQIDYYALENGSRLVERSIRMPVAGVIPFTGLAADRGWMPDFPGVKGVEKAADWEPGIPIDLKRIRDKDEAYWDAHGGAPKLFLSLEKGRELFGNRLGEYTAMRLPMDGLTYEQAVAGLLETMNPGLGGLVLRDVRKEGLAAAASPVDFAGLFLGMSLFLIVAAVALTAMLFSFQIEQRNRESGLLAAIGIPTSRVLRWRLMEALCVVTAGGAVGVFLATCYTRWLLGVLETRWSGSGASRLFQFHVEFTTLFTGLAGFVMLMMGVIWHVTRKQALRAASLRLEAGSEEMDRRPASPLPWWALGFSGLGVMAVIMPLTGLLGSEGGFFFAGFAFLLAGLAAYRWTLRRGAASVIDELTPQRLARVNCSRRATRSLVVVGALASGVFLVVSVSAFRKHDGDEWRDRSSGAGGFAFWVETMNIRQSAGGIHASDDVLDLGAVRERFGQQLAFRVGAGDDASCLNLNTVLRPKLLATDVAVLARLGAFPIKKVVSGYGKNWNSLRDGSVMRAFVDETTLMWALKKKLGDQILYQDEWGREFPIEIAGTLGGTVFQGSFVVDESRYLERYPSAAGSRLFLLESAGNPLEGRRVLQQALSDQGVVVASTSERLAALHAIENTYISIFQVLGGLGVILGSAGLGLVTVRNLIERRYEFSILHAVGVPVQVARVVLLLETAGHICWGLGVGGLAAVVSIFPTFSSVGAGGSLVRIGLLLLLLAATAMLGSWLAIRGFLADQQGGRFFCNKLAHSGV